MPDHRSNSGVLVTGGAGYVGSVLVPMLLNEGFPVTLFDRFYFGWDPIKAFARHPLLTVLPGDILTHDKCINLLKGIGTVIHLASFSNDPSCDLDPELTVQTNTLSTVSLARRAKAAGVRRFLFASSCSVYGASGGRTVAENSETRPITLYAETKLDCEKALLDLSSSGFRVTNLRFATLFGLSPRMRFDLAVNVMIKKALQNKNIVVHGDGQQYRPFVHVHDAARAFLAVMKAPDRLVADERFNIGNDSLVFTINDLASKIVSHFPGIRVENDPQAADIRSYRPDFSKSSCLGIQPKRRIEDTIHEIRHAYLRGNLGSMDEEKFYNVRVLRRWRFLASGSGLQVSNE